MKITKFIRVSVDMLAFLLAIAFTMLIILKSNPPPIKRGPLSAADARTVQECLYNNIIDADNESSLCYRLLNPSMANYLSFSASELPLRHAFYKEAAVLHALFLKWSDCRMKLNGYYRKDLCKPRLSKYKGLFKEDFKTDKYDIVQHFMFQWFKANPIVNSVRHCLHFHDSSTTKLLPQWKKCSSYVNLNLDILRQTYPRMAPFKTVWLEESFLRADLWFPAQDATQRTYLLVAQAVYNCLYSKLGRSFEHQYCSSVVNEEVTAKASNFSFIGSELVLSELSEQTEMYVRLLRSNLIYDCLKYHRHERVHWCEGVREHMFRRFADPTNSSAYDINVKHIHEIILEEKDREHFAWKIAGIGSPFKILPLRLTELCAWYTLDGELIEKRPLDCEEGGLFYPFL